MGLLMLSGVTVGIIGSFKNSNLMISKLKRSIMKSYTDNGKNAAKGDTSLNFSTPTEAVSSSSKSLAGSQAGLNILNLSSSKSTKSLSLLPKTPPKTKTIPELTMDVNESVNFKKPKLTTIPDGPESSPVNSRSTAHAVLQKDKTKASPQLDRSTRSTAHAPPSPRLPRLSSPISISNKNIPNSNVAVEKYEKLLVKVKYFKYTWMICGTLIWMLLLAGICNDWLMSFAFVIVMILFNIISHSNDRFYLIRINIVQLVVCKFCCFNVKC